MDPSVVILLSQLMILFSVYSFPFSFAKIFMHTLQNFPSIRRIKASNAHSQSLVHKCDSFYIVLFSFSAIESIHEIHSSIVVHKFIQSIETDSESFLNLLFEFYVNVKLFSLIYFERGANHKPIFMR